ncbi:acyl carrier protein [Mycobacterium sp.]|jgi:acyl carrier protein|uniref:acyl carrier protein n=1 Tax=Mycobacterium sp. TaxID=1785 RepID=UPI002D08C4F4|nr:acyl carrier protein [Mycobacterium sp.]HTH92237.1 acyl carrier protein [Mycobacterium sp.]
MSPTAERIDSLILAFLRRRLPDIDAADLHKSIYDLDVDSLDVVDLTHELESEFAVKADLDRVSDCGTWTQYRAYIRELIDAP